jgi:hypothetical protein
MRKGRNPLFPTKASTETGFRIGSSEFSTIQKAVKKAKEYAADDPGSSVEIIKWTRKTIPGRMSADYSEKTVRRIKAKPNPALPVGKKVPVYAKRLRNGRIELYR